MHLQVLLVEDNQSDLAKYMRDLPGVFQQLGLEVTLHPADTFELAKDRIRDPHRRYDLIISDTYRGEQRNGDAAVIEMVEEYRQRRFCPIVVFSASVKPDALRDSPFVIWTDKAPAGGLEQAVRTMLNTGIPQA